MGTPLPRLSWSVRATDPAWTQEAYELELTEADGTVRTERVVSSEQVLVPWPFAPLKSRDRVSVRVRAASGGQWTEISEPVRIEAGLLEEKDWTARFISPSNLGGQDQPAPLLFSQATVRPGLTSARLYVTAKGCYTFSINGQRVGDEVLAPGWTSYHHRLRYQTHDVTGLLAEGRNDLRALLGNGWHRGYLGWDGNRNHYGNRLALLAQLELHYADGTTETVGTDGTWQAVNSSILSDDLYAGERTDLRISNSPAGKDADTVDVLDGTPNHLVSPEGPPMRITEELRPKEIFRSPEGRLLIDFGQNLVGWVRLTVRGAAAGDEIIIRHAEVLERGELGVWPLRTARATDSYLLSGAAEEVLEPTFTFHGFRYAEITGAGNVDDGDVTAVVIGSDLRRTGWFECSDPDLNKLHENVVWGMRGNFLDVPVDCPQRDERLGWTGDIQVFSPTASYLFDTSGFLASWLKDLAADQYPDGTVPYVVPDMFRTPDLAPAAAWGDAATVVPWVLHERFGDLDVLRRQYPSMKGWVDKIASLAGGNHLWEGGFQFGDWLDPTAPPEHPENAQADPDVIATAYLIRSARILAATAALLGKDKDAARYRALAEASRTAFNREYVTCSGRVLSDCQTVYSLVLLWDLLETDAQRTNASRRLAELVRGAGFKVSTGFVGTPLILDALTRSGAVDLAYRMILEKGNPSWLYPVTMGATTIWERWDSMLPDGSINPGDMTSFNHYALGAVAEWMHRTIAGLAPAAPGYRKIHIKPQPGSHLTHASATHVSPYGTVAVAWTVREGTFALEARIPVGTTAEVWLPGAGQPVIAGHGTHRWQTDITTAASASSAGSPVSGEPAADALLKL